MNVLKRSLSHDATRTRRTRRITLALAATAVVTPAVAAQPPIRENPYTASPTRIATPDVVPSPKSVPVSSPTPPSEPARESQAPRDPAPRDPAPRDPAPRGAATPEAPLASKSDRPPAADELTGGKASDEIRQLFERLSSDSDSRSNAAPAATPEPASSNPNTTEPESAPRIAFTDRQPLPNRPTSSTTMTTTRPRHQRPTGPASQFESDSPIDATSSMPQSRGKSWLPSATAESHRAQAAERLARATHEYRVRAWASAEASAWEALRIATVSIDAGPGEDAGLNEVGSSDATANRSGNAVPRSACAQLDIARAAILEARGFTPLVGSRDVDAVRRLARSHQTTVLDGADSEDVSAAEAIDRYLNEARKRLAPVAAASVEAAEAMDLIAAIYLARDESKTLPGPTSLCLRRAAFQGQNENASLATQLGKQLSMVGLLDESRWVLSRSLALHPSPDAAAELIAVLERIGDSNRADEVRRFAREQGWEVRANHRAIPDVTELTPEEFATISQPVSQPGKRSATRPAAGGSGPVGRLPRHLAVPPSLSATARQGVISSSDVVADRPRVSEITGGTAATSPNVQAGDGDQAPRSAWRRMTDSIRRLW